MTEPSSLSEAVDAGDERAILEALRRRLATELEVASGREVAPLTGRLLEVMGMLRELDGSDREPTRAERLEDEVAKKRNRRRRAGGAAG